MSVEKDFMDILGTACIVIVCFLVLFFLLWIL
jgi:hypothetical protein